MENDLLEKDQKVEVGFSETYGKEVQADYDENKRGRAGFHSLVSSMEERALKAKVDSKKKKGWNKVGSRFVGEEEDEGDDDAEGSDEEEVEENGDEKSDEGGGNDGGGIEAESKDWNPAVEVFYDEAEDKYYSEGGGGELCELKSVDVEWNPAVEVIYDEAEAKYYSVGAGGERCELKGVERQADGSYKGDEEEEAEQQAVLSDTVADLIGTASGKTIAIEIKSETKINNCYGEIKDMIKAEVPTFEGAQVLEHQIKDAIAKGLQEPENAAYFCLKRKDNNIDLLKNGKITRKLRAAAKRRVNRHFQCLMLSVYEKENVSLKKTKVPVPIANPPEMAAPAAAAEGGSKGDWHDAIPPKGTEPVPFVYRVPLVAGTDVNGGTIRAWYCGWTENCEARMAENYELKNGASHGYFFGLGKFYPVDLDCVPQFWPVPPEYEEVPGFFEDALVKRTMAETGLGPRYVRGGSYSMPDIHEASRKLLLTEERHALKLCLICGSADHPATRCHQPRGAASAAAAAAAAADLEDITKSEMQDGLLQFAELLETNRVNIPPELKNLLDRL